MTMSTRQRREFKHLLATIVINTCESAPIDLREFHTMQVHIPAGWTAAALGIKVSPVEDTVFKPMYVRPCRLTTPIIRPEICSVSANTAYQFPLEIGGSGFIRLWSNDGAGVDENQTAERVIGVSLKG